MRSHPILFSPIDEVLEVFAGSGALAEELGVPAPLRRHVERMLRLQC